MKILPKVYLAMLTKNGRTMPVQGVARTEENFMKLVRKHGVPEFKTARYTIIEQSWLGIMLTFVLPKYAYRTKAKWSKWKSL